MQYAYAKFTTNMQLQCFKCASIDWIWKLICCTEVSDFIFFFEYYTLMYSTWKHMYICACTRNGEAVMQFMMYECQQKISNRITYSLLWFILSNCGKR